LLFLAVSKLFQVINWNHYIIVPCNCCYNQMGRKTNCSGNAGAIADLTVTFSDWGRRSSCSVKKAFHMVRSVSGEKPVIYKCAVFLVLYGQELG
jgi:hypothetical protein